MKFSLNKMIKATGKLLAALLILFLFVSTGLLMLNSLSSEQLNRLNSSVQEIGFYTQFIRWIFYVCLYFYWRPIINILGRLKGWNQETYDRAYKSRNQSIALLIVIELLIFQSFHIHV